MKKTALLIGCLAMTLGFSSPAHAGDCWTMLQKHFTWAQSDSGYYNNHLTFQLATNRGDGNYVSYTTGVMDVTSGSPWVFNTSSGRLGSVDGKQYFSDRRYTNCSGGFCLPAGPFNENATDVLGVMLTWSGEVSLTLKSWGGGTITGTGDCTNEMLFMNVGNTAYVFSFKQTQSAVIR
jgi:hypothetical protein